MMMVCRKNLSRELVCYEESWAAAQHSKTLPRLASI